MAQRPEVSKIHGFRGSRFQSFEVSRILSFLVVSEVLSLMVFIFKWLSLS
jgi:hypothetical protein